ncbi:hypothetical protein PB01_06225 [Psychrobacillus glaciei]|uniref:Uncharacterized protein n=1 Tax=Psychrobacillus glaciei TaxID=2283160 RepID=A0A5J6SNW8_9BACI|nr:hypothetical protein [Psychrobacillus glaciei]QFF98454.1 hypothetical protein PB01_06225 [Psychrobacillus glaciei]
MKKHGEELIYSGAWVLVIGTTISALGQTKEITMGDPNGAKWVAQGNAIQAFGNSLQGLGNIELFLEEKEPFQLDAIIGAWLQVGGNITDIVATDFEIHTSKEDGLRLNAVGSGVQGVGAAYEAVGAAAGKSPTKNLEVTGNSLFALGAFLDATGSVFVLNKMDTSGDRLSLIGSWVQVVGACVEVIALTIASNINLAQQKREVDDGIGYYWYVPNTVLLKGIQMAPL